MTEVGTNGLVVSDGTFWATAIALIAWCLIVSSAFEGRLERRALRHAGNGPAATARALRRAQVGWLAGWVLVWVLAIALAKGDADNREALVAVVPMVMAHGPIIFWKRVVMPQDLIDKGADPEIAAAAVSGGRFLAAVGGFVCMVAVYRSFGA